MFIRKSRTPKTHPVTEKDTPAPTVELVVNREELDMLFSAAVAKTTETEYYLSSYDHIGDSPPDIDSCWSPSSRPWLAGWYEDRRQKTALQEKLDGLNGLIKKIGRALKELPVEQTPDHP